MREAGIKVKRTVLPGSTFWNDWTKYPFSMTNWNMRPLGVQVLALAYRTGEAWNEAAYSNPEFDKKLNEALAIADAEKRKVLMKDIETDPAGFGHHHPALLALALQPLGAVREEPRHAPDLRARFRQGLARQGGLTSARYRERGRRAPSPRDCSRVDLHLTPTQAAGGRTCLLSSSGVSAPCC